MDVEAAKLLAAGIAAGFGVMGSGIGEGILAAKAMEAMGRNPEVGGTIFTRMIVAMAITESSAIYAVVVALVLLFVV
jgi:F-type H+-transporting ATPase subunit c